MFRFNSYVYICSQLLCFCYLPSQSVQKLACTREYRSTTTKSGFGMLPQNVVYEHIWYGDIIWFPCKAFCASFQPNQCSNIQFSHVQYGNNSFILLAPSFFFIKLTFAARSLFHCTTNCISPHSISCARKEVNFGSSTFVYVSHCNSPLGFECGVVHTEQTRKIAIVFCQRVTICLSCTRLPSIKCYVPLLIWAWLIAQKEYSIHDFHSQHNWYSNKISSFTQYGWV